MADVRAKPPAVPVPQRRRLRAYAFDPMSTRLSGRQLTLDIPYEPNLTRGPTGKLLQVVDYDASRDAWYYPINLNDRILLAQDGMSPSERDPRTHQQIVYGVAMSVIERFERFLGRRFEWGHLGKLRLIPHAFEGRNAYFDPDRQAVLFGYFPADESADSLLPQQVIFTCLSADIIAHEVTHALVHRLRRHFAEPTNPDVFAWHEAFADLVALFHHFAFPDIVAAEIAAAATDLEKADALLNLATEFGVSTSRGAALRRAINTERSPKGFREATEQHDRAAYFVTAVFEAFVDVYKASIADLRRIASGGTGILPPGALHPDLVNRVADEAVANADRLLCMVVRAFEYLPVVDVTFGDVVRAIVTADRSLYPDDERRLRATLIESLRRRGIYPEAVTSLADEALAWPPPPGPPGALTLRGDPLDEITHLMIATTMDLDIRDDSVRFPSARLEPVLENWASDHADELGLDPSRKYCIEVAGAHVSYLTAADRQPRPIIVLQFTQRRPDLEARLGVAPEDGVAGIRLYSGCTVIARVNGTVEAVVTKPFERSADVRPTAGLNEPVKSFAEQQHDLGVRRLEAIKNFLEDVEYDDPLAAWLADPSALRISFARMHADDEALNDTLPDTDADEPPADLADLGRRVLKFFRDAGAGG